MDGRKANAVFRTVITMALAALTAVIYMNTLGNGFVYDDHSQIIRNPWIKDIRYLPALFATHSFGFLGGDIGAISYRPMVFVVYMLEYAAFGLKPWGWHLINFVLHAVNCVMVFLVLSRLLRGYRAGETASQSSAVYHMPAFFASALFAAHPVNSEPVSWVGCVPELFYTFLCLVILYSHIKTSKVRLAPEFNGLRHSVLTGVLFFLAILFKETALFLPVLIVAYDCVMAKGAGFFSRERLKTYIPYAGAAAGYMALRGLALGQLAPAREFHSYLTAAQFLLNSPVMLVQEAFMLIFPSAAPFQLFDPVLTASAPEFLYSVALLCLVTAILIRYRARVHPLYAIAFFLMLFPLIPTLYSPAISRFPFADRYLYFPSVGFSLFLALLLKRMIIYGVQKGQRRFAWGVAAVFVSVAVLASLGAVKKSLVWKDDLTLWSVSAGEDPENYYALYNIAIAYFRQGRLSEGIDKMERSVEANTLRAHPDRLMLVSAIESLARAYREAGYVEKSKKNYREVLRHSPMNSSAAESLRDLCAQTGERGSLDQGNCFPVFPEPVLVSHPRTNLPS